jgi:hypothetical protein
MEARKAYENTVPNEIGKDVDSCRSLDSASRVRAEYALSISDPVHVSFQRCSVFAYNALLSER